MHYAYMDDFASRLRKARKRAGFETATDAAKSLGVKEATYLGHENGSRGGIRQKAAIIRQYARKFGVNYVWLANGEGPMEGQREVIPFDGLEPEDVQLLADMAERLRHARQKTK